MRVKAAACRNEGAGGARALFERTMQQLVADGLVRVSHRGLQERGGRHVVQVLLQPPPAEVRTAAAVGRGRWGGLARALAS